MRACDLHCGSAWDPSEHALKLVATYHLNLVLLMKIVVVRKIKINENKPNSIDKIKQIKN
jgi:hypothetical protein